MLTIWLIHYGSGSWILYIFEKIFRFGNSQMEMTQFLSFPDWKKMIPGILGYFLNPGIPGFISGKKRNSHNSRK